jgi:hypothetical protein
MTFVNELESGIVVDRTALNKLKTADMAAGLAEVYAKSKPVVMVDNVAAFFSDRNLISALNGDAEGLDLILEKRGVALTKDQKTIIVNFNNLKGYIKDQLDLLRPPAPAYPFAVAPEDWSLDTHIKFYSKQIKRAQGDTEHSIGYKTLEKIWNHAAAVWTGNSKEREMNSIQLSGYWRDVTVQNEYIKVGCQTIRRYEIEQVAVKQGWKFPEVKSEQD